MPLVAYAAGIELEGRVEMDLAHGQARRAGDELSASTLREEPPVAEHAGTALRVVIVDRPLDRLERIVGQSIQIA